MDTKLRKFSRRWYIKLTAYLTIVALSAGFVFAGATLMGKVSDPSAFESKTYADSSACSEELSRVINNLMVMQYDYVSEENVKNGGAVNEEDLYDTIYNSNAYRRYSEVWHAQANQNGYSYDENGERIAPTLPVINNEMQLAHPDWAVWEDQAFVYYLFENPAVIETARQSMIDDQLRNLARIKTYLRSVEGKFAYNAYRSENDTGIKTAEETTVKDMPIYAAYDIISESIVVYRNGQSQNSYGLGYYSYGARDSNNNFRIGVNDKLFVGIEPDYLAMREKEWAGDHSIATNCIAAMVGAVVIALLLFLYLCVVTGRVPEDDEVHLSWMDRMYSEVHIAVIAGLICIFAGMMDYVYFAERAENLWPMLMAGACGITGIGVPVLLSLFRSIKARRFIRSFAVGRICIRLIHWAASTSRSVWESGSLMGRGIALAVLIPLVCMAWVPTPFIIAGCVFFVYRTVKRFQSIQRGVQQVRQGDLDYKIDVQGGDLGKLAEDINTLSEGLETAISSEVRSERLKTELISNVSHDIKTPLTSIVTYVDLLKTELNKEAPEMAVVRDYADVIDRKTARLRVLTTDLFEAAKATSGAMNVDLEQVDVQALVRQGLGEFDDKLSAAQLDVRVSMPEKPAYILADGRLVWRILENMLSNAVKYALPSSRVYLDVTTGHGMVTMTLKNISAYELNVPAEELMERFKRGDESRSSDGSGLGLSIAMSLAQLQHGIFTIAVDGDLFKATLSMPVYERNLPIAEKDEK